MKKNRIRKWISVLLAAVIVFTTTMTDYYTGGCQMVLAQEQEQTDPAVTVQAAALPRTDLYAKAEELETPLAVYNYVRNNINYEYYGGMRKGAEGTFDSLAGNDADISCLLSEMLNAAGYETRYVSGTIRVDEKLAAGMTGKDVRTAAQIFALSGYPVSVMEDEEGNAVYFEIPHTWIECYLPYMDYRGAGNNGGEYLWVPMDAGIKTYEDVDSIYDHLSGMGSTEESAEKFVEEHPGLYMVSRKIVQQEPAYLPLSLPYETVGEASRSAEYNGAVDSITFTLSSGSSITLQSPELYNRRLTLVYTEQDGMVRPELKLEGKTVAAGSLLAPGQEHSFTMTVQSGQQRNVITNTLRAGGMHAIITDTQSITSGELKKAREELCKISSSVNEENVYTDGYLGVLLDYAGKMYFAQVDTADRIMAEEMNIIRVRSLSVGMVGYSVTAGYENSGASGIPDGTLYTDIDLDFCMAASESGSDEDVKKYVLATGMMSSAYESAIWEEITGEPSVSTVSILNDAYESGIPVLAVTDKNADEVLKTLSVTPEVLNAVRREVQTGKLVIIPQEEAAIGDWNGSGYIVLEGKHYTGQYMINGGLAGGSMNGGSGSFTVDTAYLVNLIAASVDMAESLSMTELVLAGLELGGVVGSILGVAVMLLCVTLFVLAVEEYKANVDNIFAYMSGDESAGDAIVVNAGINMAVTAAFSGADYLAKKQLAKYAAKQVTEKLGEELAERLLKDGADSTAIAKAVRSLEKSGVDNALIRKAAGELTAAEFERIGSLAKRGLAGELLEKVVDNREVLGKASDSTLLLFKNSTGSCDDIITVLLKHGDEAGQLYGLYGDDVIDIALRYGDEGLEGIRKHGTDFLVEYSAYGDDFLQSYIKNGDEVLELVIRYSDDGMEGIRKYGDKFLELYRSYGDEFVGNYVKYGDDAVDAYVKYGDNAAKVLKGEINIPDYVKLCEAMEKKIKEEGYIIIDIEDAAKANMDWKDMGYNLPPVAENTKVYNVEAGKFKYARVYKEGVNSPKSPFILRLDDIKGLSAIQIAEKYALPQIPDHIVYVQLPENIPLEVSIVGPQKSWGTIGGDTQYAIKDVLLEDDWFAKIEVLN